jgi:hypothetical protein
MQHGLFCIHCHQWCICNVIAKVRQDMIGKCIATLDDRIPLVADNGSWESSIAAAWLRAAITDLQRLEAKI